MNSRQYLINMVARGINLFRHQAHKSLFLHTIVGKTIDPEINTKCFFFLVFQNFEILPLPAVLFNLAGDIKVLKHYVPLVIPNLSVLTTPPLKVHLKLVHYRTIPPLQHYLIYGWP